MLQTPTQLSSGTTEWMTIIDCDPDSDSGCQSDVCEASRDGANRKMRSKIHYPMLQTWQQSHKRFSIGSTAS